MYVIKYIYNSYIYKPDCKKPPIIEKFIFWVECWVIEDMKNEFLKTCSTRQEDLNLGRVDYFK